MSEVPDFASVSDYGVFFYFSAVLNVACHALDISTCWLLIDEIAYYQTLLPYFGGIIALGDVMVDCACCGDS